MALRATRSFSLQVPALGDTNGLVTSHPRGGPYGRELMTSPTARGPKTTVSPKVSLEVSHQSQALRRSLQLWQLWYLGYSLETRSRATGSHLAVPCSQPTEITSQLRWWFLLLMIVLFLLHLFVCMIGMYMCMHVCMFVGIHVCESVCLCRPEVVVTSLQSAFHSVSSVRTSHWAQALLLAFMWVLGMWTLVFVLVGQVFSHWVISSSSSVVVL